AKRNDSEFIAVTMAAQSAEHSYRDTTLMLDYAFAHYETRQVAKAGEEFVSTTGEGEGSWYTKDALFVTAPLDAKIDTKVTSEGSLLVTAENGELAQFPLQRKQALKSVAATTDQPNQQLTGAEAPP